MLYLEFRPVCSKNIICNLNFMTFKADDPMVHNPSLYCAVFSHAVFLIVVCVSFSEAHLVHILFLHSARKPFSLKTCNNVFKNVLFHNFTASTVTQAAQNHRKLKKSSANCNFLPDNPQIYAKICLQMSVKFCQTKLQWSYN